MLSCHRPRPGFLNNSLTNKYSYKSLGFTYSLFIPLLSFVVGKLDLLHFLEDCAVRLALVRHCVVEVSAVRALHILLLLLLLLGVLVLILLLENHPGSSLAKGTTSISDHVYLASVIVIELLLLGVYLLLAKGGVLLWLLDHIALRGALTHVNGPHGRTSR